MPLETVNFFDKGGENGAKFTPTPEEIRTIQEKMKDPKFVELFQDYMKSMEDPETRREEEAYLQQVEREAKDGGDYSFDFVFPRPGFVVELLEPSTSYHVKHPSRSAEKGSLNRNTRVFVNMCSSEKIDPFREETTKDRKNSNWYVPVSISNPRTELFSEGTSSVTKADEKEGDDENKDEIAVYDAVFHPNTLQLADRSDRFCSFLVNIAVEHINAGHGDQHGFQFRRLPSSVASLGTPQNQTITRQKGKSPFEAAKGEPVLTHPTKTLPLTGAHDVDVKKKTATEVASLRKSERKVGGETATQLVANDAKEGNIPRHTIVHRGHIDLSDTWGWKVVDRRVGVPEALVVKMEFEGVKSAADLLVEVEGTYVTIARSDLHPYHGALTLPFTVEPVPVEAKFDRRKGMLTLVLRVVPPAPTGITAADMRQQLLRGGDTEDDTAENNSNMPHEKHEPHSADAWNTAPNGVGSPAAAPPAEEPQPQVAEKPEGPPSAPQLSCIGDQDRVRQMMEQVQAARIERERAAAAAAAAEAEAAVAASVEAAPAGEGKKDETEVVPVADEKEECCEKTLEENADAAQGESEAADAEMTTGAADLSEVEGIVGSVKDEADLGLLQQRQDAWRKEMQQRVEKKDEEERQAASVAEREVRREAERVRKRAEAAKLEEAAEVKLRERMAELPLRSRHIFTID